jgi:hypothetical protein
VLACNKPPGRVSTWGNYHFFLKFGKFPKIFPKFSEIWENFPKFADLGKNLVKNSSEYLSECVITHRKRTFRGRPCLFPANIREEVSDFPTFFPEVGKKWEKSGKMKKRLSHFKQRADLLLRLLAACSPRTSLRC